MNLSFIYVSGFSDSYIYLCLSHQGFKLVRENELNLNFLLDLYVMVLLTVFSFHIWETSLENYLKSDIVL